MQVLWSVMIILLLTSVSIVRNDLWRDDGTIWGDTIAKSPQKSRAYNELGLHLLSAGKYLQAYGVLSRSLERDPYQGQIYINIGLALEHLGRPDEAIRTYEKAIWLLPGDPTAHYNLGVIHFTVRKDLDTAIRYFLAARDLDPLEPDVHQYLSLIYNAQGDRERADREMALYERLRHH